MFTDAEFTTALEAVVKEKGGDYRFPRPHADRAAYTAGGSPRYVRDNGEGACLIGAALVRLGVSAARLALYEGLPATLALRGLVSPSATRAARVAQIHQDSGCTWEQSLALYRAAMAIQSRKDHFDEGARALYLKALGEADIRPALPRVSANASVISANGNVVLTFDIQAAASAVMYTEPAAFAASQKDHALIA